MIGIIFLISQVWSKAYDNFTQEKSHNDTAYCIAYDAIDDAYIVVGHTTPGPIGNNNDILVTKIKVSDGSVLWSKAYAFPCPMSNEHGRSVIVDYVDKETTYYVVTGYATPGFSGSPVDTADIIVFKIAKDGMLVWGFLYSGMFEQMLLNDYAYSITNTGGSYLVAGNVEPAPCGGQSDALVMSVNSLNGAVNWVWVYGAMMYGYAHTDDYLYSIIEDSTMIPCQSFVVAGKTGNPQIPFSPLVFKGINLNGNNLQGLCNYPILAGQNKCAYNIKNDHQPGYILTGDIDTTILVMKLNPNLTVGWGGKCRTYTIPMMANSRCIQPTSDSNYVFTGSANPGIPGPFDLLMTKIDPTGALIWSRVLTGCPATWMNFDDYGQYIIEYPNSFYASVGYTQWPAQAWFPTNLLVAKVDANGYISCPLSSDTCLGDVETIVDSPEVFIDTSGIEQAIRMDTLPIVSADVYVRDTLICGLSVGVEEEQIGLLSGVYSMPNPSLSKTVIHYTLATNSKVSIAIYDLAGRAVCTLVDKSMNAGKHSISWDGKDTAGKKVSPGIYFYKICTASGTKVQKAIRIR
ncbi:MAG: T9SS type A sorting domain-containing protein [Candidatus Stahlbacteria bacterium]|nr:T9SS type A sorting domain-containing protein [Candidatus Stahlbacteria bacterium]